MESKSFSFAWLYHSFTKTDNSWASILIKKNWQVTWICNELSFASLMNVGNLLSMERLLGLPVDFSASTIHCLTKLISLFGWLSMMSLSGGNNCQSSVTSGLQLELQLTSSREYSALTGWNKIWTHATEWWRRLRTNGMWNYERLVRMMLDCSVILDTCNIWFVWSHYTNITLPCLDH